MRLFRRFPGRVVPLAVAMLLMVLEHSAALAEQQLQNPQKSGSLLQSKEFLNVACKERVEPLGIEFQVPLLGKQG